MHQCNLYCLLNRNESDKKTGTALCRKCRFGYEIEVTSNDGDTTGKELRDTSTIFKDKRRDEHRLLPRRQSRRTVQYRKSFAQAWRANANVQLLIYCFNPNKPDVGKIENVYQCVVAYAAKRYKISKQEIQMIQDIIFG